jgi:hypothetical protein
VTLVYANGARPLPIVAILGLIGAAVVLLLARVAVVDQRLVAARVAAPATAIVAVFVLVAVLAVPTAESVAVVRARTGDGGELGHMPPRRVEALSRFLTRHRDHRPYEFASLNAALAGPLIVRDDQPVLILAGWPPHPLVSARGLRHAVRAGEVRYVLLSSHGSAHALRPPTKARTPRRRIVRWVRIHGTDVSHRAGLHRHGILYRLKP